jgi:membrane protein implicated in regulation of membrane protease activity
MMTLYLTCLIVGGIFIVVSPNVDLDTDVDFDAGSGADVVNGEGAAAAIKFLSFRNFVMFTAFFGLTGTVLTWLGGPFLINLAAAIALGLFAATLMHKAMSHLMKNEVGKTTNLEDLIGSPAKVTIDVSRKHRGKISVFANGRTLQLLAQVAEEAAQNEFKQGDTVIIINIQNGMAFVVEEEFV